MLDYHTIHLIFISKDTFKSFKSEVQMMSKPFFQIFILPISACRVCVYTRELSAFHIRIIRHGH